MLQEKQVKNKAMNQHDKLETLLQIPIQEYFFHIKKN